MNTMQKLGAVIAVGSATLLVSGMLTILGVGVFQAIPLAIHGFWPATAFLAGTVLLVAFLIGALLLRDL